MHEAVLRMLSQLGEQKLVDIVDCFAITEIHEYKLLSQIHGVKIGDTLRIIDARFNHLLFCEVIKIEDGDLVTLFPLGDTKNLSRQCLIQKTNGEFNIKIGNYLFGKIINGFGEVITTIAENQTFDYEEIALNSVLQVPNFSDKSIINEQFITGVKALDIMTPVGYGQRMLICAQPGVGKTTTMNMLAQSDRMDVVIVNLIGERGREINELLQVMGKNLLRKTIMVVSTSDRPFLEQVKSLYTAHAIANYYRQKGCNVLLLIDSITRFARAMREVSLGAGALLVRGYTSSVFAALPRIMEMAGKMESGSITTFYTALFEAESNSNDPLVEEVKSITDGHIVLSRKIAANGRYPAVDFLDSISRVQDNVINKEQLALLRKVQLVYAEYKDLELLIKLGEYEEGSDQHTDAIIQCYRELNKMFSQNNYLEYETTDGILTECQQLLGNYGFN